MVFADLNLNKAAKYITGIRCKNVHACTGKRATAMQQFCTSQNATPGCLPDQMKGQPRLTWGACQVELCFQCYKYHDAQLSDS